jgi:diaminopimelate decarboxylase
MTNAPNLDDFDTSLAAFRDLIKRLGQFSFSTRTESHVAHSEFEAIVNWREANKLGISPAKPELEWSAATA